MRIITYDEIRDHYQFMKLMHAAFGWAESAERTQRLRKDDERYKYPYGFALSQGPRLLGFVGVIDVPVRTVDGRTEIAGGIHSVATDPDCSRQGVASKLMEHAHDFFQGKGYRFSLLCTSRALVAHSLYRRLGYSDIAVLERIPRAYKSYPEKKKPERKRKSRAGFAGDRIAGIFEQAMPKRTGCAVRIRNWPRIWLKTRELKPERVIVREDGYAFTSTWGGTLFVDEIVALRRRTYNAILERLRRSGKSAIIIGHADDPVLQGILKRKGYSLAYGRYGVRMSKPLTRTTFQQAFGDRFYFSPLDGF